MELWATLFAGCGKAALAFPYAVNGVVHSGIASYAHFHNVFSRKHKAELSHRVLDKLQNITDEEFANLNLEVAE